jgi:hypothetical protein
MLKAPSVNVDSLVEELKPCGHMVSLISRRSDESLSGPAKWYTDFHLLTCPQCREALEGLRRLHLQVSELAATPFAATFRLSAEDWKYVEGEWAKADGYRG